MRTLSLLAAIALTGCLDAEPDLLDDADLAEDTATDDPLPPEARAALPLRIVLSQSALSIDEGGVASVAVHLSAPPPTTPYVVNIQHSGQLQHQPATVVFTAGTWSVPQGVTFTAVHDDNVVSSGDTVLFKSMFAESRLPTVIVDDDQLGIVLAAPEVIAEGAVVTTSVRLTHQPASNVTVTLASGDPWRLLLSRTSALFTPTSWAQPQTVIAHAVVDADDNDDVVTMTATAAGMSAQRTLTVEDTATGVTVGWPQPLPEQTQLLASNVYAVRITAHQPFVLADYQVYVAGQTRLSVGLYDGNAVPTQLRPGSVATVSLSSPSTDTPTVLSLPGPLALPAGTYWLAIAGDHAFDIRTGNVTPPPQRCNQPSSGATLPTSWVWPFCHSGRALSIAGSGGL